MQQSVYRAVLVGVLLLLAGCAHYPSVPITRDFLGGSTQQACLDLYAGADSVVREAGVADRGAARIPAFPYLRVDRLLASFRDEVDQPRRFEAWVDRLQALAHAGWAVEIANLPAARRRVLADQIVRGPFGGGGVNTVLNHCGAILRAADLARPSNRRALRAAARADPLYRTWQRVVGLYPVTAMFFRQGIERWHRRMRALYTRPLSGLPVLGRLQRYRPPDEHPAPVAFARLERDALGIPIIPETARAALFAAHAPVLEVDQRSGDDRIGSPVWKPDGTSVIDTSRALVFQRLAYARAGDRMLVQLVYSFWFPARTASGGLDLLAGHLDGLTWRVTLDPQGRPWVYDSIHNCGCYHLFLPTERAVIHPQADTWQEPPLVLETIRAPDQGQRLVLRLAAGTHYLLRATARDATPGPVTVYAWRDDNDLRHLPLPGGGSRSLFGPDGIVAGSERGERLLFWPMGIPSPGAMRQWGQHATAFVGRRYFDDPWLLINLFGLR